MLRERMMNILINIYSICFFIFFLVQYILVIFYKSVCDIFQGLKIITHEVEKVKLYSARYK